MRSARIASLLLCILLTQAVQGCDDENSTTPPIEINDGSDADDAEDIPPEDERSGEDASEDDALDLEEEDGADLRDADVPPEEQGELGEACSTNQGCKSGLCFIFDPATRTGVCSDQCFSVDDCPEGDFECALLDNSGADEVSICVPTVLCLDNDGDGFGLGIECTAYDCDDEEPDAYPGAEEVCDGIDNDCDGLVDNDAVGVGQNCQSDLEGACQSGETSCIEGELICEPLIPAAEEYCDGIDNDCDGEVDEGENGEPLTSACYNGPEGTANVGICREGARLCLDGQVSDCLDQVLPRPELCDGLDNDCDGLTDEDNPGANARCDTGLEGSCRLGLTRCASGELLCEPQTEAGDEICDGLDNDCDGLTDEGEDEEPLSEACYGGPEGTEGVGECRAGTRTCAEGNFEACDGEVLPESEVCDGLDNDCDGEIDEDNPAGGFVCDTGLLGACSRGQTLCTEEGTVCEPFFAPSAEICDGIDNDCDGEIDEDEDGTPLAQTCYSGPEGTDGVGACTSGTQTCVDGDFGLCEGMVLPGVEVCDGLDNDCDASTDEDNPGGNVRCDTGMEGVCAAGITSCSEGTLECIILSEGGEEVCDGRDNDCDGLTDENSEEEDIVETCYDGPEGTEGVGACTAGSRTCAEGNLGQCEEQVLPSIEVCDGVDNDCDGETDENNPGGNVRCETGQAGVCSLGVTRCTEDGIVCEPLATSGVEVCDGLDNDCDGLVDEGDDGQPLAQSCYGGPEGTDGVGACTGGVQTCTDGNFGLCEGQVLPGPEVCDGLDNNCDGAADEANPGGNVRCNTGAEGLCAQGITSCQDAEVVCIPENTASEEICDGFDNDCDGLTDEEDDGTPLTQTCYNGNEDLVGTGVCARGVRTCSAGNFGTCQDQVLPGIEICDGLDNDCDGETDEGNPGGSVQCDTGAVGACSIGITQCGEDGLTCVPLQEPGVEICDGLDNDCDGLVDEDEDGNPLARSCYDGDPDQAGVGVCRTGTEVCQAGSYGVCQGQILPSAEVCDGLDNDCNNAADDGNPGGGFSCTSDLPGVCAQGTTVCQGGAVSCLPSAEATEEVCDGLDNNCDGTIDDGFEGLGQPCTAGEGICRRTGLRVCNPGDRSGAPLCDATPGEPNEAETCDYSDDDCDGETDEGFQTNGVYDQVDNCGACGISCESRWQGGAASYNVSPICEVDGNNASCGFVCINGFVDADGLPDNGCEYDPDEGAVYVASPGSGGDDTDPTCGAWNNPCATIDNALERAEDTERARLRVSAGIYRENVDLVDGVSILGGHSARTWQRNPAIHVTVLNGVDSDGDDSVALRAQNITSDTEVSGLTINAQNAAAGGNSVAVHIVDSDEGLLLRDNILFAASGGNGVTGGRGDGGVNGAGGADGGDSLILNNCNALISGAIGGARSCANPDNIATNRNVSGGKGGDSICPVLGVQNGSGSVGLGDSPGAGGGGGHSFAECNDQCCLQPGTPIDPSPGQSGAPGDDGDGGGGASTDADFQGNQWRGESGDAGSHGDHGSGGGGGGTAAGISAPRYGQYYYGATGGGGGSGGCAGFAGNGGRAGGGSFAILMVFSGGGPSSAAAMPRLEGNILRRGNGGNGGAGGAGGAGGDGGAGGAGGARLGIGALRFCQFEGAIGSPGGRGGHGGGGGGGAGGASFDIYIHNNNGHQPAYLDNNTFTLDDDDPTGGSGGPGGTSNNTETGIGSSGSAGNSGNLIFIP